jgi:hypothetical protein
MPITLGGRTYSDDEVRQFYANGGNEAAFAQQNGLSDADAQAAMAQAHSITASPTNWGSATPQQIQDQSAQWTAQGIDFAEQARRAEAAGVNKDTLNMWSAQNHGAGRLAIDNAYSNYWLQQGRDPDGRANDLTTYNRLGPNTSGNLTDAQQLAVAARTGYGQPSSPASSPASPAPASSPITMDQIQSAWNANKDDPQKVYNLMMQHGASYRDVSKAAGMSPEQLNKYLAMPIANDTSHPYQLNYRGVPVNSQGMEMDVSGDPNWRSKVDMRHADPHFGYNDPGYGKADDPFAMDGYSAFYNGMGGSGPRPGSNNIGGRPRQYTGETNRPGHYVAPGAGVYWQQNGQADPGTPRPQQSQSFTGVNSVDHNKGVFSPTENRWISNDEIKQYFAANPGTSATELNRLAGGLGLNPYSINYAASVGTGGGLNPTYWQLAADLASSQHRGDSGYGVDLDAANRADSNPLVAGMGNTQYKMPDGSYYSVRVKDGKPQESYASALQSFNAGQAANPGWHNGGNAATVPTPKRQPAETYQPWTRPTQPAGIINSAAGQLSQGDQSPPTVVADGGQYLPDGTWSDLVNGKHTGTISPGTYAQSKIGSF